MKISVSETRRYALMRAHTATHLLHAALYQIFPQTKQAGSFVGEDELRFDFFADRLLEQAELDAITLQINQIVREHHAVSVNEMSYTDAIKAGAKAFFEDKYPEIVRVVEVESRKYKVKSVELCGGTHVADTSQIGAFCIVEQSAVAAGVKRISALTGTKVVDRLNVLDSELIGLASKVGVPKKQLEAKIDKILGEQQSLEARLQNFFVAFVKSQTFEAKQLGNVSIDEVICVDNGPFAQEFGALVEILRSTKTTPWLVYSGSGQYALFHPQAKEITKELAIKGGGSDSFVQGRDEKVIKFIKL